MVEIADATTVGGGRQRRIGLPPPEVEYIGEVHTAFWAGERKR